MAVSDAQKKSAKKWDAANLDRMSLALPKGKKDAIKAHAQAHGESVNAFISRAITETMERDYVQSCICGAPSTPIGGGGYGSSCTDGKTIEAGGAGQPVITPAALCAAQNAAKLANEELPAFIERAVTSEAKRDEVRRRLGG